MSRRQVALDRPGRRLYNKNYKNPEKLAPAPKGQREATSVEYQVQMVYEREDAEGLVREEAIGRFAGKEAAYAANANGD